MINQLLQLNVPLPERSGRFRLSIFVFFAKLQQKKKKKQSLSINQEIIRKDIKKIKPLNFSLVFVSTLKPHITLSGDFSCSFFPPIFLEVSYCMP